MSANTAKANRKMKKYAVLTREPRCFLGSLDFSWEQRKLGDISEIKTGPFGSTLHADDYVSDGTPIITTEHFKTGSLPRSKNGLPQVSDSDYKRLAAYTLDNGDIVFSRVGSVDINALITPFQSNWLFSGRVLRVRPQTDISSQFLHTRLETESIKTDIRTRAVGQTMPSINTEILKITPLVLPSSEAEQEQIGSYFAALDNLITLHQRKCALLFSSFQALISMMFTTSTFSWEQRKVSDLAEKTYGGGTPTTSNEAYWNGDIPWIQSSDVVDGKLLGVEPRKWITQDGLNNSAAQLIPGNSIAIITRVGVGKLAFMPYSYATSQDFLSLSKLNAEPLFTVYACYKKLQSELNAVQGTSIKGITKDELLAKNIMVPRYAEQQQIGAFFKQLDHLITLHQRKCISFTGRAGRLISTVNKKRITSSWEQRKLGDIGKARSGIGFPDADQGGLTGVPFFKVSDMNSDGNENEMTVANNYVTAEQIADHRWSPITELPAIFFAKVGAAVMLNRKRLCRFPFLLDNNTMAYSLSPTKWDADFAKALFGTVDLTSLVQVGALPSYNAGDVESMEIYLPSLLEQEQIGAYFKHLDNLITLHQRKPFLMKWRTSDANRNQTNRLVL